MPRPRKGAEPAIVEMPARTMAVVHTTGDPAELGESVFKALYGAVYPLKFALKKQGVEFKVEPPRARWFAGAAWRETPREQWTAAWALPLPDGTAQVTSKEGGLPVEVETWEYGAVAQITHYGPYAEEEPTIDRLHGFIAESGYEIAGPHEEEYLSRPGAKDQKTIIRYQIRRADGH